MRHTNKVLAVFAAVALLAALYTTAYLVNEVKFYRLVQPFEPEFTTLGQMTRIPHYRVGGQAAEIVFSPAQRLHAWLRPDDWSNKVAPLSPIPTTP
jgi:hypothetical protein